MTARQNYFRFWGIWIYVNMSPEKSFRERRGRAQESENRNIWAVLVSPSYVRTRN